MSPAHLMRIGGAIQRPRRSLRRAVDGAVATFLLVAIGGALGILLAWVIERVGDLVLGALR